MGITWYLLYGSMSSGTALTDLNINDTKRKSMNKTKRVNEFKKSCYYDMKTKLNNEKKCCERVGARKAVLWK